MLASQGYGVGHGQRKLVGGAAAKRERLLNPLVFYRQALY